MTRTLDPTKRKAGPRKRGAARIAAKAAEATRQPELPPYYLPGNPEGEPPSRDDDLAFEILTWMYPETTRGLYRTHRDVANYRHGQSRDELLHTWHGLKEARAFNGRYFEKFGRIDPSRSMEEDDTRQSPSLVSPAAPAADR